MDDLDFGNQRRGFDFRFGLKHSNSLFFVFYDFKKTKLVFLLTVNDAKKLFIEMFTISIKFLTSTFDFGSFRVVTGVEGVFKKSKG